MPPTPMPTPSIEPILVELVGGNGASAPWWGVPAVAGGFLIIGALLGFWFNRLQDDRKAKRDRVQRWDDRLLELTSDVISQFEKFSQIAIEAGQLEDGKRKLREDGLISQSEAPELEEMHSVASVGAAFFALSKACTNLELIAPDDVRRAAAPMRTFTLARVNPTGYEAMADQVMQLDNQKKILEAAVRNHLGIK